MKFFNMSALIVLWCTPV